MNRFARKASLTGSTVVPAESAPYLQVRDLTKTFGRFTALRDVSLDIVEGEFVCFLGPSGCGKTTLLRAICGLDVQTWGSIRQAGRDVSALPAGSRDFGIVFQSYALFPNMTVLRNVAYGLRARRLPRARVEARVAELLDLVGLADQGPKYPSQLSGGQQQRVALARALAPEPGLLLLDEPLSALDAQVRLRLRTEIRDLQRRLGVTTIMVTHDQEEALAMADRVVVMHAGRIEQVGTPADVYGRPATPFVAEFIGRMNFLPGEMAASDRVRFGRRILHCEPDGARDVGGVGMGGAVTVAIRPEDVVIRGLTDRTPNVLPVRIMQMEFRGNHFSTALLAEDLDRPIMADFSANAVRDLDLRPGADVLVAFPPARLRLFAPR
ncbi:MAG: putative 2-aminoethylphosphonate ABC transporter ATP-binding protein [Alphaproteobacteria bacterium]